MGGFGEPQRDLPHSEALVDVTADLAHDLPRTPRSRADHECLDFLDSDGNLLELVKYCPERATGARPRGRPTRRQAAPANASFERKQSFCDGPLAHFLAMSTLRVTVVRKW